MDTSDDWELGFFFFLLKVSFAHRSDSKGFDSFLFFQSNSSLFQMLSAIVATGIFLFTIGILGRLPMPSLPSWRKYRQVNSPPQTSSIARVQLQSLEPDKVYLRYI